METESGTDRYWEKGGERVSERHWEDEWTADGQV